MNYTLAIYLFYISTSFADEKKLFISIFHWLNGRDGKKMAFDRIPYGGGGGGGGGDYKKTLL